MGDGILKIFLSSTVLSIQVGITSAWSAENDRSNPSLLRSAGGVSAGNNGKSASVPTVSDRRKPSESREFILGADGVAIAAENSEDPTDSGSTAVAYAATGSLKYFTGMANNNAPSSRSAASPVPECGPSPLPPEKIKILVEQAARRHQVDELFADAITWAESQFDRSRNSDKGARGPMQLMPDTAARFGVRDVCDPEANIEGGMKYLRALLDEFRNPLLVAAAYNAGESRVYEYGGIPPFKETVGYVAKVVNYEMGIPMPALKSRVSGKNMNPAPDMASQTETGVIAVKKNGTFVGGVMHF